MINLAILIGNIGKTPEMSYTATGLAICKFSLATSEKYKDEVKTQWHNIVVFGKQAENVSKFVFKGSKVYIEGKINTESWDDKEGKKCYRTNVIANTIRFLDSKKDEPTSHQESHTTVSNDSFNISNDADYTVDTIPF